jgi:hypothetical protein
MFTRLTARSRPEPAPLPYEESSEQGLAARWVRWVASGGVFHNPVDDTTGEDAHRGQPDDVWFCAGAATAKARTRRCIVPADRPLFLPAVNAWEAPALGPVPVLPGATGEVLLDGVAQPLREIATPRPFDVVGSVGNGVTGRRGPVPVTVWGLWARIAPLPPGPHELHVRGGAAGDFSLDVRYHLTVA